MSCTDDSAFSVNQERIEPNAYFSKKCMLGLVELESKGVLHVERN